MPLHACRVILTGFCSSWLVRRLRVEHRIALLVRPFGLPSRTACSALKVAAIRPISPDTLHRDMLVAEFSSS